LNLAAVERPPVEPADEHEQRHMDDRQVPGEPRGQVDVGDGSAGGARPFGQPGERAPEPARGEDQALAGDDRRGRAGPPVTAAGRAGPQQVADTGLDGEPRRGVNAADQHEPTGMDLQGD
jgi:hypothetical protein